MKTKVKYFVVLQLSKRALFSMAWRIIDKTDSQENRWALFLPYLRQVNSDKELISLPLIAKSGKDVSFSLSYLTYHLKEMLNTSDSYDTDPWFHLTESFYLNREIGNKNTHNYFARILLYSFVYLLLFILYAIDTNVLAE